MYKIVQVEMLVLTDYESLIEEWSDPSKRKRWGVLCTPFFNNGNWLIPLGWEEELEKAGVAFEKKLVDYKQVNEIIIE